MSNLNLVYDDTIFGRGYIFYNEDENGRVIKFIKIATKFYILDDEYVITAKDNNSNFRPGEEKKIELSFETDNLAYLPLLNLYSKLKGEETRNLYSSSSKRDFIFITKKDNNLILSAVKLIQYLDSELNNLFIMTTGTSEDFEHFNEFREFYNQISKLNLPEENFYIKQYVK